MTPDPHVCFVKDYVEEEYTRADEWFMRGHDPSQLLEGTLDLTGGGSTLTRSVSVREEQSTRPVFQKTDRVTTGSKESFTDNKESPKTT